MFRFKDGFKRVEKNRFEVKISRKYSCLDQGKDCEITAFFVLNFSHNQLSSVLG